MKKRQKKKNEKKESTKSHGKFEFIRVENLRIDPSYQRKPVSDQIINRIVNSFDWNAFSTLLVGRRESGLNYIVDGQQRWIAARKIGAEHVPCFVFPSRGAAHEARKFIQANTHRVSVKSIEKWAAAVSAKKKPEIIIKAWLDSVGIPVTGEPIPFSIRYVTQLIRLWERNPEACQRAIKTQMALCDGEPLISSIDGGLWWLENGGVSTAPHVKRLLTQGGRPVIQKKISQLKIELYGGGTPSEKIAGLAMLRMINKRKKNKVGLHLITA